MVAALRRSKGALCNANVGLPSAAHEEGLCHVPASLDMAEGLDLFHVGVVGTVDDEFLVNALRPLLSKLCTLDLC